MTQKFGWKLAVLVLLCACVSSGTAQTRGRTRAQRRAERAAYSNGQVFVYLTPEGELKQVACKSTALVKKAKLEALELHHTRQQAYTQKRGKFVEKNPNQKYAPLKPFKPEFITVKAVIGYTNKRYTVEPKEHYYGLYKVVANGRVTYEVGYAFSDAIQQLKYRARYISLYNGWVKKSKATTEPIAPVFEKLCEQMTKTNAQKAARAMATWQKQHNLWVKRGSKPESEPEKPDLSIYQEELSRAEKWKNSRERQKNKAKDDPKEKKDTPKSEKDPKEKKDTPKTKNDPNEKKDTPKTKNDAGWS